MKPELKSGMVLELKRQYSSKSSFWLVVDVNGDLRTTKLAGSTHEGCHNLSLSEKDIIRIYNSKDSIVAYRDHAGNIDGLGKILWEKNPTIVELTLESIAERFNLRVEQIKIKEI